MATAPTSTPTNTEALSTSLDPVEITSPESKRLSEIAFRHSGWAAERRRVQAALETADVPETRIARFANCGAYAWVLRSKADPTQLRVSASFCHDRLCKPCQRARANRMVHAVMAHVPRKRLRFVTLTTKHSRLPLALQLQKLTLCFRSLRRTSVWRKATSGGIAFIEVKRSNDGEYWHPHLHVIHEGTYIPHAAIRNAWKRLTRDSFVVHLRSVSNQDTVARYVTTYANKPYDHSLTRHPEQLAETVTAFYNRRTVFTFGTWRAIRLNERPDEIDAWTPILPLYELLASVSRGEPEAVDLLAQLRRTTPCLPTNPEQHPNPPPNQPYSA